MCFEEGGDPYTVTEGSEAFLSYGLPPAENEEAGFLHSLTSKIEPRPYVIEPSCEVRELE